MENSKKSLQYKPKKNYLLIKNLRFLVGYYHTVKEEIVTQITRRKSMIVLACSLHDVAIASLYPNLIQYYREVDMCTTDGMLLVWWAIFHTRHIAERVYGPDLMKSILVETQGDRFRHVFCGSSLTHLKSLTDRITHIAPKAHIVGVFAPQIELKETTEERSCLQQIVECKPSVLWLGISTPKQVVLAARWKKHFPRTAIICVGAAFDLVSGSLPRAPAWVQAIGFEWLFRLICEPKRLYKRYLIIIPRFILREITAKLRAFLRAYFVF